MPAVPGLVRPRSNCSIFAEPTVRYQLSRPLQRRTRARFRMRALTPRKAQLVQRRPFPAPGLARVRRASHVFQRTPAIGISPILPKCREALLSLTASIEQLAARFVLPLPARASEEQIEP